MENGLLDVDTVVLLGHSAQAVQKMRAVLDETAVRVGRPMRFVEWCTSEADAARATVVVRDGRLTAAILVIDPDALSSSVFATAARRFVHEAIITQSFALFVVLDGVTRHQIVQLAGSGVPLMADIINCIQIPSQAGAHDVRDHLVAHLLRLETVQRFTAWRERYDLGVRILGRLAIALEVIAVAASLVLVFPAFNSKEFDSVQGFLAATLWFPSGCVVLRRLRRSAASIRRQAALWSRCLLVIAALATGSVLVRDSGAMLWPWLVQGLVVGALLEGARRSALHVPKRLLDVSAVADALTDHASRPTFSDSDLREADPSMWRLLPQRHVRAFISYTLASTWSRELAERLYLDVSRSFGTSFLDRHSIVIGSAWRNALSHGVGAATHVVVVLDPQAMRSAWVAAEVVTALLRCSVTGWPRLVLCCDRPVEAFTSDPLRLPIFEEILTAVRCGRTDLIDVIVDRPPVEACTAIMAQLRRSRRPILVPRGFAIPVLVAGATFAAAAPLAFFVGAISWVFGALQYLEKYDILSVLRDKGYLVAVFVVLASMLGAGSRMLLARRVDPDPDGGRRRFDVPTDVLLIGGIVIMLILAAPLVSSIALSSAVVCGLASWALVDIGLEPTMSRLSVQSPAVTYGAVPRD